MKNILLILVAIFAIALSACEKNEDPQVYRAEASNFSYGWKPFLEVETDGNEIISVNFDYFDQDGNLKSETTMDNYKMEPHPTVFIPEYKSRLLAVDITNFSGVDVISGATGTWSNVNALMSAVISAINDGDTSTQIVVME